MDATEQRAQRQPRGTALIVAMAIVMILAGLSMVLMNEMRTRAQRSEADGEDVKAFEAAEAGMDAALVDPCTPGLVPTILAAEALAGKDEFCMNYVTAERQGKLT